MKRLATLTNQPPTRLNIHTLPQNLQPNKRHPRPRQLPRHSPRAPHPATPVPDVRGDSHGVPTTTALPSGDGDPRHGHDDDDEDGGRYDGRRRGGVGSGGAAAPDVQLRAHPQRDRRQ